MTFVQDPGIAAASGESETRAPGQQVMHRAGPVVEVAAVRCNVGRLRQDQLQLIGGTQIGIICVG